MQITDIKIKKSSKSAPMVLGLATVVFDECLIIHNIKIINLKGQRIIAFPSKKMQITTDNVTSLEFKDVVHPLNSDFRSYIENAIFEVLDKGE